MIRAFIFRKLLYLLLVIYMKRSIANVQNILQEFLF